MLIMRLMLLFSVLGIGGSILLWMLTGNPRYKALAWKIFRIALVVLFAILALFAIERVLVPIV